MKYIIIFVIVIIIILLLNVLTKRKTNNHEIYYQYRDIRPKLKTGDIILFSCKKHQNIKDTIAYYCRTNLIGSEYGHAGVILRYNDKLYLVESTAENQIGEKCAYRLNKKGKGGVRIVDLDILLQQYYNEHASFFAVKFISKEIPTNLFLQQLDNYKNQEFENKIFLVLIAILDIFIYHPAAVKAVENFQDKNKIMCSEFVHNILNKCGVLKNYPSKLFWPHVLTNEIFEKLDNCGYSPLYLFTIS